MKEDMDGCSVVDCVSHTLLAALAATQPGRQWGLKMQVLRLDYFLCYFNFCFPCMGNGQDCLEIGLRHFLSSSRTFSQSISMDITFKFTTAPIEYW
jgi:hypothetical protein